MKKDYRLPGFAVSLCLFILGLYLLGHAGANWIISGSGTEMETGALFSIKRTATIQFVFGISVAIIAFLIFVVLSKKRIGLEEDF